MDNFAEYLVKKKPDAQDRSKKIVILTIVVVLSLITIAAAYLVRIPFILIITCAVIYGGWFFINNLSVEYEYAITNDEMDVDKIIARRKREHLVTVSIRSFEAYGEYTDDIPDAEEKTLVLCSDNTGVGAYYADLEDEDYGSMRIIFTPNESVCEAIEAVLPYKLRKNG